MTEYEKRWLKAAAIRAIKTVAQTALGVIVATAITTEYVTIGAVDWVYVASAASMAGIASLLTSLAGLPEVEAKNE